MNKRAARALLAILVSSLGGIAWGEVDYGAQIRPLLRSACTHCHGEEEKLGGGVDLRLRRFMLRKTEDGSSVVEPGVPERSELVRVLREGEMPKKGRKLSDAQIALIERWIREGARISETEPEELPPGAYLTDADRTFWAFRPVLRKSAPRFGDLPGLGAIDAYVRERLRGIGMDFAPEADRKTLMRRLRLDLTGLPPTPEETAAFVEDNRPDAYERVVERLLADPAYGERWGRHWLDVAGYSDTNGYAEADSLRPHVWRYRDYVIRSLNEDKPWDRFIQEQLAGDELAGVVAGAVGDAVHDPLKRDALTATAFLRLAPDGTGDANDDAKLAQNQNIADTIRVVSSALTGMTVGCAQCHDHRYDPITQEDYYRMRAVFEPALNWKKWRPPAQMLTSLYAREERERAAAIEKEAAVIDAEAKRMERGFLDEIFEKKILEVPEGERDAYRAARAEDAAKRSPEQKALLKKYYSAQALFGLDLYDAKLDKQVKDKKAEATKLRATKPIEGMMTVVTEPAGEAPRTVLFHRGDHDQPRQEVEPGDLKVLGAPPFKKGDGLSTSGRRMAYAKWLTSGRHPLVGRVLMNRIWMHHMGRGIVNSPGDFGVQGERPTHPELLDYLADRFVEVGWSLKAMHREMVMSRTYRQTSQHPVSTEKDPENQLYGRFRVRRLDAETVRDSMLSVAGALRTEMYGPPVTAARSPEGRIVAGLEVLNANRDVIRVDTSAPEVNRRSVYLQMRRKMPVTVLETFDLPVMDPNCEVRASSTVAPQALFLMNDDFVVRTARVLAERVRKELPGQMREQVGLLWRLVFGVDPRADEVDRFLVGLSEQSEQIRERVAKMPVGKEVVQPDAGLEAMASLCQVLLSSNRFLYLE
jgi:mono/diheme cytochrome c family protein